MTDVRRDPDLAAAVADETEGLAITSRSFGRQTWDRFRHHKIAMAASMVLILLTVVFIVGPWLAPHGFEEISSATREPPSLDHPFGTDDIGRDLMVRTFMGGRFSLRIALLVAVLTTGIGATIGALAGYFAGQRIAWFSITATLLTGWLFGGILIGLLSRSTTLMLFSLIGLAAPLFYYAGKFLVKQPFIVRAVLASVLGMAAVVFLVAALAVGGAALWIVTAVLVLLAGGFTEIDIDVFLSQVTNLFLIVPAFVILLVVAVRWGSSANGIAILLAFLLWPQIARIVRGLVMQYKEQEFVMAARAAGAGSIRIMARHIIPNTFGPIIVNATLLIGAAIILESTLSFLGLGVRPPTPTLGNLVNEAKGAIDDGPTRILIPGGFVVLIALCINFLGDGLRDALDPTSRRGRR